MTSSSTVSSNFLEINDFDAAIIFRSAILLDFLIISAPTFFLHILLTIEHERYSVIIRCDIDHYQNPIYLNAIHLGRDHTMEWLSHSECTHLIPAANIDCNAELCYRPDFLGGYKRLELCFQYRGRNLHSSGKYSDDYGFSEYLAHLVQRSDGFEYKHRTRMLL